jgi:hypothetical protein
MCVGPGKLHNQPLTAGVNCLVGLTRLIQAGKQQIVRKSVFGPQLDSQPRLARGAFSLALAVENFA